MRANRADRVEALAAPIDGDRDAARLEEGAIARGELGGRRDRGPTQHFHCQHCVPPLSAGRAPAREAAAGCA